jgi:hypothetical protein
VITWVDWALGAFWGSGLVIYLWFLPRWVDRALAKVESKGLSTKEERK